MFILYYGRKLISIYELRQESFKTFAKLWSDDPDSELNP